MSTFVHDRVERKVPPDMLSSLVLQTLFDAICLELHAMYEKLSQIQDWFFPQTADSEGLAIWERIIDLPVDPVDVTLEDRRNRITSKLISRFQFFGKDFREGVELIGGPIVATTVDTATGTVTIELSGVASQYAVDQVEKYCLESGPAHLQWIIVSPSAASAFIVGISQAGDSL